MISPNLLTMCFRSLSAGCLIGALAAVSTVVTFAQPPGNDDDPYKSGRYTGYGSPTDRVYERDDPKNTSLSLRENERLHHYLYTTGDFDHDNKEDIVFFRKLELGHYILVVVSDYHNPFQWGERETVIGEFDDLYNIRVLRTGISGNSSMSLCPFYSQYHLFTTPLKSNESRSLNFDARAIFVSKDEAWITVVYWDNGEYKYFCDEIFW